MFPNKADISKDTILNGRFVGMMRLIQMHSVSAQDRKDGASNVMNEEVLFPQLVRLLTEVLFPQLGRGGAGVLPHG